MSGSRLVVLHRMSSGPSAFLGYVYVKMSAHHKSDIPGHKLQLVTPYRDHDLLLDGIVGSPDSYLQGAIAIF
jgi:hypothetical protein